jgi:CheY-like chemotaxis protein/PAS domain-containing protein
MAETLKKIQELIEQNKLLEKRNEELKNIIDINLSQPGFEPDIQIKDLIGKTEIENLVFKFYHSNKIPAALLCINSKILFSVGWKNSVEKIHPENKNFISTNDIIQFFNQKNNDQKHFLHKCMLGVNTIAFPIIIKNDLRAILLLGYFFHKNEVPNFTVINSFITNYQLDEDIILKLLSEIPVYTIAETDNLINQGILLSEMISFIGTKNFEFFKRFKQQTESNTLLNSLKKKITEQDTVIKKLIFSFLEHKKDLDENTVNKSVLKKETQKLNQKLARTETILNSILTSSPLGICLLKEGIITFANDQMFRLSGYSIKEILGRPLEFILPETKAWEKLIEEPDTIILKQNLSFSSQLHRKNNETINILGFLTQINPGKPKEGHTLSLLDMNTLYNPVTYSLKNTSTTLIPQQIKGDCNDWSNKTILIAEDEELNYLYLKKLLSPTKINVKWAENGQKAIDMFNDNPEINLVLMDIKMPVMNGIDATRIIKSINKQTPIIAQTAFFQENTKEVVTNAGCDEYLAKPIDSEYFFTVLEKYLCKIKPKGDFA